MNSKNNRAPFSHIMVVPSPIPIRMLCGINASKAPSGDTIANTDAPHTATCPQCMECFDKLTAPLRAKHKRELAGPGLLDQYYDWAHGGDSGLSSKALVQAITGASLLAVADAGRYPLDPDDFGRCSRVLAKFPELRTQLSKVAALGPVWAALIEHWDELEQLYAQDIEDVRTHGSGAKACAWRHEYGIDPFRMYNRMRELQGIPPAVYAPRAEKRGRRA